MELPHGEIISYILWSHHPAFDYLFWGTGPSHPSLEPALNLWDNHYLIGMAARVAILNQTPIYRMFPPTGQDGRVDYNTLGNMVTAHILGEVGS